LQYYGEIELSTIRERFEKEISELCKDNQRVIYEDTVIYKNLYPCKFNFNEYRQILCVSTLLSDKAINYVRGADIYSYLEIDTSRFALIYIDSEFRVRKMLSNFQVGISYWCYDDTNFSNQYKRKMIKLLKDYERVVKQEPEVIMYNLSFNLLHPTILFMKDSKIFAYLTKRNLTYELNDYIQKYYTTKNIHCLAQHNVDFRKKGFIIVPFEDILNCEPKKPARAYL